MSNEREIGVQLTRANVAGYEKGFKAALADYAEPLRKYVEYFGAMHFYGCPGDDTCDCRYKPINEKINELLKLISVENQA
jgi:hypothetical protein